MSATTITFGLVAVPVRVFPATRESAGLSFHLLHAKDGVRLRQQLVCPEDGAVVPRTEAVKGFEYAKGQYVTFTHDELKALDQQASAGIEVTEFVPTGSIPPLYFDRSFYLGPAKGGDRAFGLLVAALKEKDLLAVGQYAARGKDYLVALQPFEGRLVMHQLFHADEVRPVAGVPAGKTETKPAELKLALELIARLTSEGLDPGRYEDEVRKRIRALIDQKVSGGELKASAEVSAPGKVIDLMEALKASLAAKSQKAAAAPKRRPAKVRPAKLRRAG